MWRPTLVEDEEALRGAASADRAEEERDTRCALDSMSDEPASSRARATARLLLDQRATQAC